MFMWCFVLLCFVDTKGWKWFDMVYHELYWVVMNTLIALCSYMYVQISRKRCQQIEIEVEKQLHEFQRQRCLHNYSKWLFFASSHVKYVIKAHHSWASCYDHGWILQDQFPVRSFFHFLKNNPNAGYICEMPCSYYRCQYELIQWF